MYEDPISVSFVRCRKKLHHPLWPDLWPSQPKKKWLVFDQQIYFNHGAQIILQAKPAAKKKVKKLPKKKPSKPAAKETAKPTAKKPVKAAKSAKKVDKKPVKAEKKPEAPVDEDEFVEAEYQGGTATTPSSKPSLDTDMYIYIR